jgi:ribose transport system substrate-binding protein
MKKKVLDLLVVVSLLLLFVPVASAAPPAQQVCAQDYVVQKNDWLSKLADKYLGDVGAYQAIADATNARNKEDPSYARIADVNLIEPGWRLCIPPAAPAPTAAEPAAVPTGKGIKVLLSMKESGAGSPFWAALEQGAKEAAAALGNVELTVLAPPAGVDAATQASQIEAQIAQGVQAICVAPPDATALTPTFDKADAAGIPVLFVETEGKWVRAQTFIGTDDSAGGVTAGDFICRRLGPGSGSKVAFIAGDMEQQMHSDRINNAWAVMKGCKLGVLTVAQMGYVDRAGGMSAMEGILRIEPDVSAVFASDDNMALGAVEAVKKAGKTGIFVVGFGASPEARESIAKGELAASVAPIPYNMGKLCVENAVKVVGGERIAPRIDSGSEMLAGAGGLPAGCVPQEGKAMMMVVNTGYAEISFEVSEQTRIVPGVDTVPEGGVACIQLDPGRYSYSVGRADGQGNRADLDLKAGEVRRLLFK